MFRLNGKQPFDSITLGGHRFRFYNDLSYNADMSLVESQRTMEMIYRNSSKDEKMCHPHSFYEEGSIDNVCIVDNAVWDIMPKDGNTVKFARNMYKSLFGDENGQKAEKTTVLGVESLIRPML